MKSYSVQFITNSSSVVTQIYWTPSITQEAHESTIEALKDKIQHLMPGDIDLDQLSRLLWTMRIDHWFDEETYRSDFEKAKSKALELLDEFKTKPISYELDTSFRLSFSDALALSLIIMGLKDQLPEGYDWCCSPE